MPRKIKPDRDKGRPVRISNEVLTTLKRKAKAGESFDSVLRRMLGMPDRNGKAQPIQVFWAIASKLILKKSQAEAKGEAVLLAVKDGKKRIIESPIKVIEAI